MGLMVGFEPGFRRMRGVGNGVAPGVEGAVYGAAAWMTRVGAARVGGHRARKFLIICLPAVVMMDSG